MKFKLLEELNKQYPYMLRNDGKLIQITDNNLMDINFIVHPYLIDKSIYEVTNDLTIDDICDMFFYDWGGVSMKWFYKNTKSQEAKNNMDRVVSSLVKYQKSESGEDKFNQLLQRTGLENVLKSFWISEDLILDYNEVPIQYVNLNNALNQEFCRFRFSGKYKNGNTSSIWFRISSVEFNWFNLIWKVCYDNKHQIDTVNICTDLQSKNTETFYKIKGKEIKDYPIEDFIMLQGNPVIESKNTVVKRLQLGENYFEIFNREFPGRSLTQYNYLKKQYLKEGLEL